MEYPTELTIQPDGDHFIFGLCIRLGMYDYRYEGMVIKSIDLVHLKTVVSELVTSVIRPGTIGYNYNWSWSHVDQK